MGGDHVAGRAQRGHWPRNPGKDFGDLQGMSPGSELFLSQSFLTEERTHHASLVDGCLGAGAGDSVPVGFNPVNRFKPPACGCLLEDKGVGFAIPFSRLKTGVPAGGWCLGCPVHLCEGADA